MFNNGLEDSFILKIPENSAVSAGIEYACSAWEVAIALAGSSLTRNLATAYYATGFREEGFSNKAVTCSLFGGGVDQFGQQFGVMIFEMGCSGMGAMSNHDGLHAPNATWNPEANLADTEMFEHVWPILWLGRGVLKDGGGFGRRQGGASIESLYVVEHDLKHIESGNIGSLDNVSWWGIMGGYPASPRYKYAVVDTDYAERVAKQLPLPHSEGDDPANPDFATLLKGTLKRYPGQQSSTIYKRYDILQQTSGGGGGWGDPIERNPEDVIDDLVNGFTSEYTASNVYCVVWDPAAMKVDYEATEAKRRETRTKRLERGIPTKDYLKNEKKKIEAGIMPSVPKDMYNDCFERSEKFLREYKEFWELGDSFQGF
jgi:acetone carboxylase alpha subunit